MVLRFRKRTILNEFINKIYNNDDKKKDSDVVDCSYGKGIKFIRDELKFCQNKYQ